MKRLVVILSLFTASASSAQVSKTSPAVPGVTPMSLDVLQAKDEIQQLRLKFAHALDQRDFALMETLFTEEVDTDYSAWGLAKKKMPRAELIGILKHAFRREGLRTEHLYSNFIIDVKGSSASAQSNWVGYHHLKGFEGGDEFVLHAQYRDVVTRTPAGWRISTTALSIFYATGNPALIQ